MIRLKVLTIVRIIAVLGLVLARLVTFPRVAQAEEASPFEVSFEQLGYPERTLYDPTSALRYYFALPTNWQPEDGTFAELFLNFSYSGINYLPSNLLVIRLNNQVLTSTEFTRSGETSLQVLLPGKILYAPETGEANILELQFTAYVDCANNADAQAQVAVRSSSRLHFEYSTSPISYDLGNFPVPLYFDNSLSPVDVRFVLPEHPDDTELRAALVIAARLGADSRNTLPLSVSYTNNLTPELEQASHLVVIGTPATNPLITQLELPVPARPRSLEMHSRIPAVVIPGQPFTMEIRVINTSMEPQTLAIVDRLPDGTTLDCQGACTQLASGSYRWDIGTLQAREESTVQFQATIDGAVFLPGSSFEHRPSLLSENGEVLNGHSLSTVVDPTATAEATSRRIESAVNHADYIFVRDGEAVADGDGIIEELASPGNPDRAVIVVTGLSEDALFKAGQALGSLTQFPGVRGAVAIVKSATSAAEPRAVLEDEVTFSALGYQEKGLSQLISGLGAVSGDIAQIYFNLPPGWSAEESASLVLHYSYSSVMATMFSSLEVSLNSLPVKSILLDDQEVTENLWASINLPNNYFKPGPNRLSIKLIGDFPTCITYQMAQSFWAQVFSDSYLHLPQGILSGDVVLQGYPYLFTAQPDLSDVLFALPAQPSEAQLQQVLNLSASLGYSAGGSQFLPRVVLGEASVEAYSGFNVIAYGRPTENPTISLLNRYLPQPFVPGTDKIQQGLDNVIYRLPDDYELGYIQLLSSPWSDDGRAVMAITGTTTQGVTWSINALLDQNLAYQLGGNLVILTSANGLRTTDTRILTPGTAFPAPSITPQAASVAAAATDTPLPTQTAARADTPSATSRAWFLLPLLGLSVLVIVVTVYVTRRQT